MKKNILILLSLCLIILLFLTCSLQNLVKGTVWVGAMEMMDIERDIEAFFRTDNTIKAYITMDMTSDFTFYVEGSYTISNTHAFKADLEGDMGGADLKIDIDGILNYHTGMGDGEYEMEYMGMPLEGDWSLTKVGSN